MKIKRKIVFSGLTIIAVATPVIVYQQKTKTTENKNIDLYKYSLPSLKGKPFLLEKLDVNGLALRIGYEDYYLRPNEINKPGKIILKNGLELTWTKALTSRSDSSTFKIMNQPVKSFVNRIKLSRINSESSSLLYVKALGRMERLFIYEKEFLESTLKAYLSMPNSSMKINWKVVNGLVSQDNIKTLNSLLQPGGYQIDKIKGSFTNGVFTLSEFKLKK